MSPAPSPDVRIERGKGKVSVSRVIAASPADLFAVVADPAKHPLIDGSGTVRDARGDQILTKVGDTFGMDMKLGVPYRISNTVKEFEQDRLIAWCHPGRHRWRYEFEEVDGGTLVTETFEWGTAPLPVRKGIEFAGYPDRHPTAMVATLERLAGLVEGD